MNLKEYAIHVQSFISAIENRDALGIWVHDDSNKIKEKRMQADSRITKLKTKLKQTTESILSKGEQP